MSEAEPPAARQAGERAADEPATVSVRDGGDDDAVRLEAGKLPPTVGVEHDHESRLEDRRGRRSGTERQAERDQRSRE